MNILDLDEDLDDLRGLALCRPVGAEEAGDLISEMDEGWRRRLNVPETGYFVSRGYGLKTLSVSKVAFIKPVHMPGWSRQRSRCWVQYRCLGYLWYAADQAPFLDTRLFVGRIETFHFTLRDVAVALKEAKEWYKKEALSNMAALRSSLDHLKKEHKTLQTILNDLDAFDPAAVLPAEELELETIQNALQHLKEPT